MLANHAWPVFSVKAILYGPQSLIYTAALLMVVVACLFFTWRCRHTPRTSRISDLNEAYAVLNHGKGKEYLLRARSEANRRLQHAFGIDNAFTTFDTNLHAAFVSEVHSLLRTTPEEWRHISQTARRSARHLIPEMGETSSLAGFMQRITLSTVLCMFYRVEIADLDNERLGFVTASINSLWEASKCGTNDTAMRRRVLDILQTWCGKRSKGNSDFLPQNALNFILPSYETLWRVVLHGFLELRTTNNAAHGLHFNMFLAGLSDADFRSAAHGASVEHMMKETLRLYPPIKRIKRVIGGRPIAIDVEAITHDVELWGEDANTWRPERWPSITARQQRAFLPLGGGQLSCPANKWACCDHCFGSPPRARGL